MHALHFKTLLFINKGNTSGKLILFTRHLHLMLRSGLTVSDSIQQLHTQEKNELWQIILEDIANRVRKGIALSLAMEKYPSIFSAFYVNLIRIGEESGTSVEVLLYLLRYLEKQRSIKRIVIAALTYPLIVLIVAFCLSVFLGLFILPRLMNFFTAFGTELPLATRILMWVATFMGTYGIQFFLLLGVGIALLTAVVQTNFAKPYWQQFQLHLPIIGKLLQSNALAQLNYDLNLLLKSGIPIISALKVAKKAATLIMVQNALEDVERRLTKGESLAEALKKNPKAFPNTYVSLISVGEQTGNLAETTQFVAEYYEDEVEQSARSLGSVLEPLLLIVVSLIVGVIALAIISPIYQLTGSLRQ